MSGLSGIQGPQNGAQFYPIGENPQGENRNDFDLDCCKLIEMMWRAIQDFCIERWRELRIACLEVSTLFTCCPTAIENHIDAITDFERHMMRRRSEDSTERRHLLNRFQELPEPVRNSFVDLSEAALEQFINQNDPIKAQKMLTRFSNECNCIATAHRIMLPVRQMFARCFPCNADHSVEVPERPAREEGKQEIIKPKETDFVPIQSMQTAQVVRGETIRALYLLIGEEYNPTKSGDSYLKTIGYECPITSITARIPVIHHDVLVHYFERENLMAWMQSNNTCPLCRVPATLGDFRIYVDLQKTIENKLIDAILDVPEEWIIKRMRDLLEFEFVQEESGKTRQEVVLTEQQLNDALVKLIQALPANVHGREIRAWVRGLYEREFVKKIT